MIVTVALNAALDVLYETHQVVWGATSEVSHVRRRAGGRGVDVAKVLHTFGHEVVVAGLVGGATGEVISHELSKMGIPTAFTRIAGESRRVLRILDVSDRRTTRLREPAPYVTTEELGRFAVDYRRLLADATAVVLCGSLPAGLPAEIYGSLASYAAEAGVPVILNTAGDPLRYGAARCPDLVVPEPVPDDPGDPAADVALLDLGAQAVARSTVDGVRVVSEAGRWTARLAALVDDGKPRSAGCRAPGALVAGLVPGLLLDWSWPDRLRHAVAVSAAVDAVGDVDLAVYENRLDEVEVDGAAG